MKRTVLSLAALMIAGCSTSQPEALSETEANRAAITDYAQTLMVEGRPYDAFARYYADDLIQHDPWIDDGGAGDEEFLEERREENPEEYDATDAYENVIHTIMADGDLVALKSHVFTSRNDPGRVFVDIWRMEGGKFVEHWDVIQPVTEEMRDAIGCGVGTTYEAAAALGSSVEAPACGLPDSLVDSAQSRQTIEDYLAMGQQPGRLVEAIETYNQPDLVQHAQRIPGGRQGLIEYMTERAEARAADQRASQIARIIADGDMVMVHRRVTSASDPRGAAIIDLFRLRDGKVAEHWDVVQPIPEFSVSGRSMVDGPLEPGRYHGPPSPEQEH